MAIIELFLAFQVLFQDQPDTPEKALAGMTLPEGFAATLFASEPMVSQPMAMPGAVSG